ncbi:MAG: GDP-mannose 4,6-dehydratase [DPANN group archaeon]|nr:GDP-mannose 4,6-dehydratase [DPANN group archaeon]
MPTALITGITGQDGSYLAEFLLDKNYEVWGIIRRASTFNTKRIDHLYRDVHKPRKLHLIHGDLTDGSFLGRLIRKITPDEIYNLGAQSHVRVSFEMPEYTADVVGMGTLRLLETIRDSKHKTKFYQASSSEMYGGTYNGMIDETTPLRPRSPYACAKAFAHHTTQNYREGYGIFAVNGVLFNHESPRRGETFVTRKITRGIASILAGQESKLYLGNLEAKRDWGYTPEYVEAMWLMLQQEKPEDYVIATGESHSVKEFLQEAFNYVGLDWEKHVVIDPRYYRPTEVDVLIGNPAKAKAKLNWQSKTTFKELVRIMVDADMREAGLK